MEDKAPNVSLPGNGLLATVAKKINTRKINNNSTANPVDKKTTGVVNSNVTTATNPPGITRLNKKESGASLAATRASIRAKVDAAKAAQAKARQRQSN